MSEVIESASALIRSRIAEIDAEAAKLRSALSSLGGGVPPLASSGTEPRRRRAGKRAPRGQRREQVLAAAKKSPGASAAELGRAVGISTNQAYGLAQRLLKDGALKKIGKGYKTA